MNPSESDEHSVPAVNKVIDIINQSFCITT